MEPSDSSITSGQSKLYGEVSGVHIYAIPPAQMPTEWLADELTVSDRDATIQSKTITCTVLTFGKVKIYQLQVYSRASVVHPST
jgi:hypothetical protein